jgi:hypothetical protein
MQRHPRVHFHFTPTSTSSRNTVDIWFSILRSAGASRDVAELIAAIEHYIDGYNDLARPFVWTKPAEQILDKAIKRQDTSETLH